jgi:lipopolysaccharide export system permease protein
MLFQSSMRKELARSFGATLVVLITIIMTIVLIRTLGLAARGSISPQDVMLIMAYSALGRLPTILTLSLFIAMVSTLSRMYRDSEMVVWFASGRGLTAFLSPMFRFAWPVLLVIGLSALFVWPWSNQQTAEMRERYDQRGDIDRIAPGQFQESSSGNRVFFIDRASEGRAASSNIFIAATEKNKNAVTTARSGRVEVVNNVQMLMLENGQRLETTAGSQAIKISDFEEYGLRTGKDVGLTGNAQSVNAVPTQALVKDLNLRFQGELSWRLGLMFSAVNFVVLALALAAVNPRAGRGSNLLFVLFTFITYSNLLGMGQSWVNAGLVSFGQLLVLLHGGVLAASLLWLAKRHHNWSLKDLRRPEVLVPGSSGRQA